MTVTEKTILTLLKKGYSQKELHSGRAAGVCIKRSFVIKIQFGFLRYLIENYLR